MSALLGLQKAIFAALSGDAALTAALGGARIYDALTPAAAFPYVSFGRASAFDWSTATDQGAEHLVSLHVWSRAKGRREALAVMALVAVRLHDTALVLEGARLVNLRLEAEDIRYDADAEAYRGALRFRAVTEAS